MKRSEERPGAEQEENFLNKPLKVIFEAIIFDIIKVCLAFQYIPVYSSYKLSPFLHLNNLALFSARAFRKLFHFQHVHV